MKIKDFLEKIEKIQSEYTKLSMLKGERFNIFSLLNLTYKEDRLHSKLIFELLNPNGSHDMGDVFLRLFLNMIGENQHQQIVKSNLGTEIK
jgi:hypothetical protein